MKKFLSKFAYYFIFKRGAIMKIKKILAPIDFSEFSDHALSHALFLAEKQNAQLTLLHVYILHQENMNEESFVLEYEKFVKRKEEEIFGLLQEHNKKANVKGISIDSQVVRGFSAAGAILEYINEYEFDVVVMGTHGRTGLKKWLYGSVAEKIVRLSPIPVLTTIGSIKKYAIDKILIPVDFSEYSKQAAKCAISLAQEYGSHLIFLHVIDQNIHPSLFASGVTNIFQFDSELHGRSTTKLKEFAGISEENATFVTVSGKAHQEIVDYAKENEIDLILMATRGLSGLEHTLLGSTSERVVQLAHCPVLTLEREDRLQ